MKSVEVLMDEAVNEHYDAVAIANDQLLDRFDAIILAACPSLRFVAERDSDGLSQGIEYAIAIDECEVLVEGGEGAKVIFLLYRVGEKFKELDCIEIDHVGLLSHLGLLDD
jgi:uncharacterized protein YlaN (UPF0358 family)